MPRVPWGSQPVVSGKQVIFLIPKTYLKSTHFCLGEPEEHEATLKRCLQDPSGIFIFTDGLTSYAYAHIYLYIHMGLAVEVVRSKHLNGLELRASRKFFLVMNDG